MKPPDPLIEWKGATHLPNALLFNPDLSAGAIRLWSLIKCLSWQRGYAWASEPTFGRYMHLSGRQVHRYSLELQRAGLVEITPQDGLSNHYRLLPLTDLTGVAADPPQSTSPLTDLTGVRRAPDPVPCQIRQGTPDISDSPPLTNMTANIRNNMKQKNEALSIRPSPRRSERTTPDPAPLTSPYIAGVIMDFSRELGDPHDAANITQAHRLWRESGLDETTFVQRCYAAKKKLRLSQAGVDNKGAYFFTLLRQEVQAA